MPDKIDEILNQRKAAEKQTESESEGDKFFSILVGESMEEHFLELQFRNGMQTCFSYDELLWFNHDPEAGCIDMEIGSFIITIKGRGLRPIFNGIKNKRVAWIKEADTELQDRKENECFVEELSITPPKEYAEEESTPE